MKVNTSFTKDQLLTLILEKFSTQKALDEAIGLTESQMSHALSKPSKKFLLKIKRAGIEIEKLDQSQFKNSQNNSGTQRINGSITNDITDEEEKLKTENIYLKELLREKDERIKDKDERIIELKKTIERLEKGKQA